MYSFCCALTETRLRYYVVSTVSIRVCRALKPRCQCVVSQPHKNGINASSSLSPSCVSQTSSWLFNTVLPPASRATPCLYARAEGPG
jgi:hypothetical protein